MACDVYMRFGYKDPDTGDVKWNVKHDWNGVPDIAFSAMQKILLAAETELAKLGEMNAAMKAGGQAPSNQQGPRPGNPGKP